MAMYSTTPTTTPLSTKFVALLGMLLVGVGVSWAVTDQIRGTATESDAGELPASALPGTLPNLDHMLQYVALLVTAVCAAGFLVAARAVVKMR
jgi:hypothetical protein